MLRQLPELVGDAGGVREDNGGIAHGPVAEPGADGVHRTVGSPAGGVGQALMAGVGTARRHGEGELKSWDHDVGDRHGQ